MATVTTTPDGHGMTEDQKALLASIEGQPGPLQPYQEGQLAALRRSGTVLEQARIDMLTRGVPGQQPAPAATTKQDYERYLADARTDGSCPTCGQSMSRGT